MAKQKHFHGAFVFRNEGHGILSSTYFNTPTPKPYPETAILFSGENFNDPFLGNFDTTWIENTRHVSGRLKISANESYPNAYNLEWTEVADIDKVVWKGIGNIEGDVMIGCYWEV